MAPISRIAWTIVVACVSGAVWTGCQRPAQPASSPITAELVSANNRAVARMGQFDFDAAVRAFEALQAAHPSWPGARLNLAIALMNRQQSGDAARAEETFRSLMSDPETGRRARYNLAVLLAHEGRDAEARPLLEQLADGQPPDGFAAYFAGQQRLNAEPADALSWFEKARQREPLLRSAYYGAFLALRRLGRDGEAATMLERFQALERHPQATLAEFKYTRMGPLSEVVPVDEPERPPPSVPSGERFLPPVPLLESPVAWKRSGPRAISVADIDGDGSLDVFVADAREGPRPNAVLFRRGASVSLDTAHPLASVSGVRAALWGDLDDDGRVDVVLCRPAGGTRVYRQTENGGWSDVTPAGIGPAGSDIVDGALFDADHDGDLDVWLINAAGPNELLNNDGDWRFRAIGAQAGIAGDGRPSLGVAIADLDGDRDADVLVVKATPPHDVFLNDRAWVYHRATDAAALAAAPFSAAIAGDVDADGHIELYTAGTAGLQQWRPERDGSWRAVMVNATDGVAGPLAWADVDGDGSLELVASRGEAWGAYAPSATIGAWAAVARADGPAPGGWGVAHLDAAAGPSIVGIDAGGRVVIWRPGPGRLAYAALAFTGRDATSDQRRSNVSGIGTRGAVRIGSRWTAFDTTRLASGPGQSAQPLTIGLGGAPRIDFVTLTWSDGVLQTESALEAGRLHTIAETQRQLSSCPVLFAWNGSGFAFVTDLLGVGGVGFFERPGVYAEPLPRENLLLPAETMAPVDGAYRLRIAEPMEEVAYLDRLSVVAYDLPPGWRMTLDERKAVAGPVPTGDPIFFRDERLPVTAVDETGQDVTARLRAADRLAVGPRALVPRFIGLAQPFSVTVTFDTPIERGPGRPVLLVDGWVEYPYAQTMFAAWQAGAAYEAPTLEARGADGRWQVVAREFGYPAGMPRQMAFPLPALPSGTTALRLRTSQEIYWDRIAVVHAEPRPDVTRVVLPLESAALEAVGFAKRTTGSQRTPQYDEARSLPLDDTRHPRGRYTAFGPVDELVAEEDGAVAIVGPGEAVTLSFVALTTAPPQGWTRRLVLEARGWCKDMDLYTKDGETVDPVPGPDTEARRRLHALFNTRYAGGR